jgi:type I restriction enzyme S subunit
MEWTIKKLVDVCDLQNGFAFKSKDYTDNSNTLNIRMSNIRPDGSFNPDHNIRFLPDSYVKEYPSFLLQEGDLVIAMTDMAGEPKILGLPTLVGNLNGRRFLMNQRVGKLFDFSDDIYIPYLRYYLSSPIIKEYYKSKGAGGLQINISKKDVLSADIPLPPIPEQKRIVALLDTVFIDLEQTRAKTEQNLKNSHELFDSYLQQVFSQKGDGWEDKRLDEICTFSSGGTPSKKNDDYWDGDIPWVSGRDMKKTQLSDTFLHISQCAVDEGSARIAPTGTLLTLVRGMGLAHGAQVTELMVPSAFNQDIKGIHINPNIVSRFLVYVLRQKINSSADIISSAAHGTLKINMDALKSVVVPVPPKEQQQNIVDRLNSFIEDVGSLELIYHKKLSAIDELKKSILQKAFSGELTTMAK